MRKLIVNEFLTLDGVMESPEEWQFPYMSEDVAVHLQHQMDSLGAQLLGRKTYEIFAEHWPQRTNNEFGMADKLNSMPKYVVSTTLEKADWQNTTVINDNVFDEIQRLKNEDGGPISIVGSSVLVQSLLATDLIDEYQLMVHPIVVGGGQRLFDNGLEKLPLKLVSSKVFDSGVLLLTYQPLHQS